MNPDDIRTEFSRVWESHNILTSRMQYLIGAVATVSASAQSLCTKIDYFITNGMNRCTSHEERLRDQESQLKSIRRLLWGFIAGVVTGSVAIVATLLLTRLKGIITP